jgi:hypothetical protein
MARVRIAACVRHAVQAHNMGPLDHLARHELHRRVISGRGGGDEGAGRFATFERDGEAEGLFTGGRLNWHDHGHREPEQWTARRVGRVGARHPSEVGARCKAIGVDTDREAARLAHEGHGRGGADPRLAGVEIELDLEVQELLKLLG